MVTYGFFLFEVRGSISWRNIEKDSSVVYSSSSYSSSFSSRTMNGCINWRKEIINIGVFYIEIKER